MFTKPHLVFVAQTFVCKRLRVRPSVRSRLDGGRKPTGCFALSRKHWIGDVRQLSSFGLSSADPTFSEVRVARLHFLPSSADIISRIRQYSKSQWFSTSYILKPPEV